MTKVILLDSQSTMNIFCNEDFVADIKDSEQTLTLHSNGGKLASNQVATVDGLKTITWFNTKTVTNILSLKHVARQCRVTYDSRDGMFIVHRRHKGLPNMHFKMHKSGLHVYQPKQDEQFVFIQTVTKNMEGFSKREVKRAYKAAKLYIRLVYPSEKILIGSS